MEFRRVLFRSRVAQPERICLARGNTDLVSPTIGVQRFRHHGRDEMARPMPLEDRVVELDLRDPSIQGLVHPDPDRLLAALLSVAGTAGRGLASPPQGTFQGTPPPRTGG